MGLFQLAARIFALGVLAAFGTAWAGGKTPAAPPKAVCAQCHLDADDDIVTPPAKAFTRLENEQFVDVHAQAGLSCADCHGGDPADEDGGHDEKRGFTGKPAAAAIPGLCGRCHGNIEYMREFNPKLPTDQLREYWTSLHGKKLKAGDKKVATCINCHGAHGIRKTKDPAAPVYPTHIPETCAKCHANADYMKEYGIPTNQLEKYRKSRHGQMVLEEGDITAPVCNTCHGNHGAAAPGVTAVHNICGTCHAQQDEYFSKSTHAAAFRDRKLPGCVTCHGNHEIAHPGDHFLEAKAGGPCLRCHETGDRCYVAVDKMRSLMTALEEDSKTAEAELKAVEKLGMGVEKAKFSLNEVHDKLTRARIKIHQFKMNSVEEEVKPGQAIVGAARDRAKKALSEWQNRRKGLAVSLVLIVITIAALLMKIRQMDGPRKGKPE